MARHYSKDVLKKIFSTGTHFGINEVLRKRYLENFTEEEQRAIVSEINIENLRKDGNYQTLTLLRRLNDVIPGKYKEEIKKTLTEGDNQDFTFLIGRKHLHGFSKEELTELFENFNFKKLELSLFRQLLTMDVPLFTLKYKEARDESTKVVSTKKEIIQKFEIGNYLSLYEIFYKGWYGDVFYEERMSHLITKDFEEIFEVVAKSEKYKVNFANSLHRKNPPFSILFKVLYSIIELTKNITKIMFKEQAFKVFTSGSPLNIVAFLSRPIYMQIFTKKELKKVFTFKNKNLKNSVLKALEKDNSAPLPLVVLKRLTDNGDKKAKKQLTKQILHLITTGSTPVKKFLQKDGFIKSLQHLNIEMQIKQETSGDYYSKGIQERNLKNFENALHYFNKALELKPEYVMMWINKGEMLRELGKFSEAIECFDHALTLDPTHIYAKNLKKKLINHIS